MNLVKNYHWTYLKIIIIIVLLFLYVGGVQNLKFWKIVFLKYTDNGSDIV